MITQVETAATVDPMRICQHCRYWVAVSRQVGECRRYPPAAPNNQGVWMFPMLGAAEWCGEFMPEPATSATFVTGGPNG